MLRFTAAKMLRLEFLGDVVRFRRRRGGRDGLAGDAAGRDGLLLDGLLLERDVLLGRDRGGLDRVGLAGRGGGARLLVRRRLLGRGRLQGAEILRGLGTGGRRGRRRRGRGGRGDRRGIGGGRRRLCALSEGKAGGERKGDAGDEEGPERAEHLS